MARVLIGRASPYVGGMGIRDKRWELLDFWKGFPLSGPYLPWETKHFPSMRGYVFGGLSLAEGGIFDWDRGVRGGVREAFLRSVVGFG